MYKFKNTDQQKVLADYLRNDRLFAGKRISSTNFYKLLAGLAVEIGRLEGILDSIAINYDINQTNQLLEEWESALGLPDDCFPIADTNAERINNIIAKLNASGVVTNDDFVELGALLGLTVTIQTGLDVLTFPFTFPFLLSNQNPRFVMVINVPTSEVGEVFPFTFPFVLSGDVKGQIVVCLFQKLVPAFIKVLINRT